MRVDYFVRHALLRRLVLIAPALLVVAACKDKKDDAPSATSSTAQPSVPPTPSGSAAAPSASASSSSAPAAETPGMKRIPAGDFKIGADDIGDTEKPVHQVHVDAFEMDVTEVTVAKYGECVATGRCAPAVTGLYCNGARKDRVDHPTNCVDFKRATAYCEWAGKRLPTEEEWEYAARGTDGRKYPWGNDGQSPSKRACWYHMDGTCAVGSYPSGDSPFGLHDMVGNVAEWTSSFFSDNYDKPRDKTNHVVRGGAFYVASTINGELDTSSARAASRWLAIPTQADYRYGIRCARSTTNQ
jgi:formylglycine-generating enzyme required for sulfatase activity